MFKKLILIIFVLSTMFLIGCSTEKEELIEEMEFNIYKLQESGNNLCRSKGQFFRRVYTKDLEMYQVVCYHPSPLKFFEYEVEKYK